jgi:hypothetical protein
MRALLPLLLPVLGSLYGAKIKNEATAREEMKADCAPLTTKGVPPALPGRQ